MGLTPITEVDVLVATHGWWPWLLTLAIILTVVAFVINYFAKRRRKAKSHFSANRKLAPRNELCLP